MSQYTYIVKGWTCQRLDEINDAILGKNEFWKGLTSAEQIISIQWVPQEQVYYVQWRERLWLNSDAEVAEHQ